MYKQKMKYGQIKKYRLGLVILKFSEAPFKSFELHSERIPDSVLSP